jgi:hypothetical protein
MVSNSLSCSGVLNEHIPLQDKKRVIYKHQMTIHLGLAVLFLNLKSKQYHQCQQNEQSPLTPTH